MSFSHKKRCFERNVVKFFYAKKINDTYYIIFSTSENLDFDSKYGTRTTKIQFIESQNKVLAEDIYSLKKYNKNSNNLLIEYVKKQ